MKSDVSNLLELEDCIYRDACSRCPADVFDLRDLEVIRSRVEQEGLSFLTITLPTFARDLEKGLASGFVDSSYFQGFRKYGAIPAFLGGMLSQLFDRKTGRLYEVTNNNRFSATYIDSIRQICLAFKKVALECTPKRVRSAISSFVHIEQEFSDSQLPSSYTDFIRVSGLLFSRCLDAISFESMVPRHGPGATAERISGNQKYVWKRWYDRLEPFFPVLGNAYTMGAFESQELELLTIVPETNEDPVRIITVPKTLKTPRIIAIEPVCMQYAQQALRSKLYASIEADELLAGQINFTDQTINKALVMTGSTDGSIATIDLSDASDRVPANIVFDMLGTHPDIRDAVFACRSTSARLPSGDIIPLKKFASMGSALCFPVEAMYFYAICVLALLDDLDLPISNRNIKIVAKSVFVYGDDIIVPTRQVGTVLDYLQQYNCKVNVQKSFWTGKFRESCGTDAYDGQDVTPTYVRSLHPENRRQVSRIVSWLETANSFYLRGYWKTAFHMYDTCEKHIELPYVSNTSEGLGRKSFLQYRTAERWNPGLQRFEVKAWTVNPVFKEDRIEGYSALMKSLTKLEGIDLQDSRDARHLERVARYGVVALKRRWVATLS